MSVVLTHQRPSKPSLVLPVLCACFGAAVAYGFTLLLSSISFLMFAGILILGMSGGLMLAGLLRSQEMEQGQWALLLQGQAVGVIGFVMMIASFLV